MTYNGWTNWDTWHANLEADNERELYDEYLLLVHEYSNALDDALIRGEGEDTLEEEFKDALALYYQHIILNSSADYSIWKINWDELWENFLNDVKEEREYAN